MKVFIKSAIISVFVSSIALTAMAGNDPWRDFEPSQSINELTIFSLHDSSSRQGDTVSEGVAFRDLAPQQDINELAIFSLYSSTPSNDYDTTPGNQAFRDLSPQQDINELAIYGLFQNNAAAY
ncbi:hypothetical protein Selin_0038 [Desulfurispirillum indicum S5]|uniref:Uncharacterized protein n=1 Tax=Desulfurispirillum indicum (strain ATCC BAA-1389 / DSM 22839 / S5) TaxID=653733 RepID=E6W4R9_DESIS|nr:hypothetical protein [Desulfurispirillum indicum]ADU64797.1 hypothetical protein Selin_0038 [Desulfurispirillum indicum S5]